MTCGECLYNFICCNSTALYPDPYDFQFNGYSVTVENEEKFESNFVKTSKYTWYSFLPCKLIVILRWSSATV